MEDYQVKVSHVYVTSGKSPKIYVFLCNPLFSSRRPFWEKCMEIPSNDLKYNKVKCIP